jgi:predicted nuclease of predicted toxin-antitoxin system
MILADENIHSLIITTLRNAGFEVTSVREMTSGITDERVIDIALRNDWILITQDKDFGEWVFAHHIKNLTVFFLRYSFVDVEEIAQTLVRLLKSDEHPRPFFATVTTKKIRVRQL